jgi:A/G-specific adenine glycosylase
MTEVPTTHWSCEFDERRSLGDAPRLAKARPQWRRVPGSVSHVFTHFPLQLVVYAATVHAGVPAPAGMRWTPLAGLTDEALPNVMRKVVAHAFSARGEPAKVAAASITRSAKWRMKRRLT